MWESSGGHSQVWLTFIPPAAKQFSKGIWHTSGEQLPSRKLPALVCGAETSISLMVSNEAWLWLEDQNVFQCLKTKNMRRLDVLVKNLSPKFQILQTVKSQPMGSFPSRWLVMSHSVSITTHSQHLSLKSLCGSLTIQGVSVGNWALLVPHTDNKARVKRLCWVTSGQLQDYCHGLILSVWMVITLFSNIILFIYFILQNTVHEEKLVRLKMKWNILTASEKWRDITWFIYILVQ